MNEMTTTAKDKTLLIVTLPKDEHAANRRRKIEIEK